MKLIVTGVTRTGNLGGTAMLCAVEDVLDAEVNDFALASILPQQDKAQQGPDNARIIAADYRVWLLLCAPLCLLLWPLRKVALIRKAMSKLPILKDFSMADAVVDLSGIAFVDGRGLGLLAYNAALPLPALFFDIPVYKLSQALGPFNTVINRSIARWILSRCQRIVARGKISLSHVHNLGLTSAMHFPDVSFALNIEKKTYDKAKKIIDECVAIREKKPLVILSPSAVVARHCQNRNISLTEVIYTVIMALHSEDVTCAFLPHSTHTGIAKNDDEAIIREITEKLSEQGIKIPVFDAQGDPRLARALIGQADVFIACRFHSLIAALSQAVPVTTIGWSHKYHEAAEPFGMADYAMDYQVITDEKLYSYVMELLHKRNALADTMRKAADIAYDQAVKGIRIVVNQESK